MKIKELALLLEGTVEGDDEIDITGVSGSESAITGDLTFALDEEKLAIAEGSSTACILTTPTIRKSAKPLIRVKNPKLSFLIVYNTLLRTQSKKSFRHPSATIADSAKLGANVWVGSHVTIEDDVTIGDNTIIDSGCVIKKNCVIGHFCHLHPHVVLYAGSILKNNVIIHSGTVIGSDGYGYVKDKGIIYKFPQLGKVVIGDDVEIGANTAIDRGSLSDTTIGAGTKIDNHCHIAHNVKMGKNVFMTAHGVIAGSTTIGDNVSLSGGVGINDNVTIGHNVTVGGQSCVIGNLPDNAFVWGWPARPIAQTKKQMAVLS